MARRTKADALLTRQKLLDAAEVLFQRQGVSRTSLADIAAEAGATRGAIYWHFQDKNDLFEAMMERVTLPLEEALHTPTVEPAASGSEALHRICDVLLLALHNMVHDAHTRRVFEIAIHKVEYTEETCALAQRRLQVFRDAVAMTSQALQQAALHQKVELPTPPEAAALNLHMQIDGLLAFWLLDPCAFDLETIGRQALQTQLRGLGLSIRTAAGESTP